MRPIAALLLLPTLSFAAEVERVWYSYSKADASRITVSWETKEPEVSRIQYGAATVPQVMTVDGERTRHAIEIPSPPKGVSWDCLIGKDGASRARIKGIPDGELRIAVVGDWGYAPDADLSALLKDDVHLLLTAGDNVPSLHKKGNEGANAYRALIDRHPEIFRNIPFMPVLGNHDHEIKPRGKQPPAEPVYDISAEVYRDFFTLPDDEWKWDLRIGSHDLHLLALDINHIHDRGTTWESCHPWDAESEQFRWFRDTVDQSRGGFVIAVNNEKQTALKAKAGGIWDDQFHKISALVTGFGYFADRAELKEGIPYFNTCLKFGGTLYPDPQSVFFAPESSYLLLTIPSGAKEATAQLKDLEGKVMDTRMIQKLSR